ncbi:MAG TPA: NBR1-Ig-like domain-containing protein [Anaerolineales bacterium]|nr:NBR1-Ig-like domain-containing protein [Anaerolineales bacterium]
MISLLSVLVMTSCNIPVNTPPAENQSIGQIEKLQGGVQAGPASSLTTVESLRDMYNNDAVHVYNNGKAELDFGHGLAFTLYNDTVSGGARVDDGGTSPQAEIRLSEGGLKGYNPPGSETRVKLPNDVNILILGTHYVVAYDPVADETWVYNFDGLLQYELPPGGYQALSSGTLLKIDKAQMTHLYYGFKFSEQDFDARATSLNSPIQAVREIVRDGLVIPVTGETATPTNTPTATATLTSLPTSTQIPTLTATPIPCYSARFVADVTIPDGSMISPLTFFTKTWRIRNTGSCVWDANYQVVFVGGTQMFAAASNAFPWTAGVVGYGQTADITVSLVSPRLPGMYQGDFMLMAPNGRYFGLGTEHKSFWVRIVVPEPSTPTPSPTPTITPTISTPWTITPGTLTSGPVVP